MRRSLVILLVACSSGGVAPDGGGTGGGASMGGGGGNGGGASDAGCVVTGTGGAGGMADCSCVSTAQGDGGVLQGALTAVAFSGSRWFAVGGGLVLSAATPSQWTVEALPRVANGQSSLSDVAAIGDVAVAVGVGTGANSHRMVRTPQCWVYRPVGTNNLDVMAGGGRFLTHAGVEPGAAVSVDGHTWTPIDFGAAGHFAYDGDRFVALRASLAGTSGFTYSPNGSLWSTADAGATDWCALYAVHRAGAQVVIFGSRGSTQCGMNNVQAVAGPGADLGNVTTTPVTLPGRLWDMQLAGDGTRLLSLVDGVLRTTPLPYGSGPWTEVDLAGRGWSLSDIAWGANTFVAVGSAGNRALVATSPDGVTWQEVPLAR